MDEKKQFGIIQQAKDISRMLSANELTDDELNLYAEAKNIGSAKVHVSKPQISIRLGIENKVTQDLTEDEKHCLMSSSDGLVLNAFPNSDKRFSKFKSLEEGCRKKLKELSIGNSSFITEQAFREFLTFFDEKHAEWQEAQRVILEVFDEQIDSFKKNAQGIIRKLCPDHAGILLNELQRKTEIKAKQFVDGFSLGLETDFDENTIDDEVFKEAVAVARRNVLFDGIRAAIEGMLQQAWTACCKYLDTLLKLTVDTTDTKKKAKNMLISDAVAIGNDGNFTVINTISYGMKITANELLRDRAIEYCFRTMSIVAGEARYNNIELPQQCIPDDPFNRGYQVDIFELAREYEEDYREDVLNCTFSFD